MAGTSQFDRAPDTLVLVEKPLATSFPDARTLVEAADAGRLVPLYHAAYAPEVLWAGDNLGRLIARHGPIGRFVSFFSDPLDTSEHRARAHESYKDSWLDSGSNALSVLCSLGLVDAVTGLHWERAQFSTAVATTVGPDGELGTIVTQWTVTSPSKATTLTLADGTAVVLDHQATAARVIDPSGGVEELAGWTADTPRLVRHYANLYSAELVDRASAFSPADHERMVTMLFPTPG